MIGNTPFSKTKPCSNKPQKKVLTYAWPHVDDFKLHRALFWILIAVPVFPASVYFTTFWTFNHIARPDEIKIGRP